MERTLTLAGREYTIKPLPLGRLRVVLPAFNRCAVDFAAGRIDEKTIGDMVVIIAGALGISTDDAENIPATAPDLVAAIDLIAEVSGLKPHQEGCESGEKSRALQTGTSFTHGL